ncbi:MAG: ATP-binding cassette domain-containing protein [Fibrobacter sp.]|nr:ATP-binding cassette domain-containing protein [Fibrobacter sp.]
MASTFFVQKISANAPFLIGRGKDVDFPLKDASVSRHHAKIECIDGHWIFKNLSQTSGTLFEGKSIEEREIQNGDVFMLGLQQLRFSLKQGELSLSHVRSIEDVPAIPLTPGKAILLHRGTNDDDPGTILHPACPKVLAKAVLEKNRLKIVFEHQLLQRTQYLENHGTLKLPWCLLEFRDGNLFVHQKDIGFSLIVKDISVELSNKEILRDIRFSLPAGKILSIIGMSGQGKSTFLELLAGKVRKSKGSIHLDSINHEESDVRREIAYLPQEPLLRDSLTVIETLRLAARITLPKDYSSKETDDRAHALLQLLHISALEKCRVGVLSGGERRRVAIASQLMGAPGLILLDEPLSGLDPLNAKRLCAHLKILASKGHTVILTTHSYEALQVSDEVLLIHQGQMGFYGTPQDAFRFFNAEDPEGILETLSERTASNWTESGRGNAIEEPEPTPSFFPKVPRKNMFFYFFLLLFKQWFRDHGKAISLILQPMVIGFLLSQIFSRNSSLWVAAFALLLCANWFSLSLSVREIVQEKALLLDEFRKGTSPLSILSSKLIFTTFFALLETGIAYAFFADNIEVYPSVYLWGTILLTVLPASAAGLLLSTFAKNPGQANAFLPLIILPQIALSGALVPKDQTTGLAQILTHAVWTSFDLSALQNVFTGQNPAILDLAIPAGIAFLIYIIALIALETMKKAK